MDITNFFSQPVNAELAMLISSAPLNEDEQRTWFKLLPFMSDDEKRELADNLRKTVKNFVKMEQKALEKFYREITQ